MTTKTDDIKLPELPVAVPWHKGYDRESLESYARAAVEANQRGQGNTLDMDVVTEKLRGMAASGYETAMAFGVSQDSFERLARQVFDYALLLRYGSSQPAEGQEVSIDISTGDHDAGRRAFGKLTGEVNPSAHGDVWLAEGYINEPAASAEPSQAIFALGHIAAFAGTRTLKTIRQIREYAKHNADSYRAPVAQEPVAYLACDPETGEPVWGEDCVCKDNVYSPEDTGTIGRPVVFATPVAAQAQPSGNAGELSDEREAFVAWLSGEFPRAWPAWMAERAWDNNHVAAMAWRVAQSTAQGREGVEHEVLAEHSGCGRGTQVEQVTVKLNPGDKVVMVKGRITRAFDAADAARAAKEE